MRPLAVFLFILSLLFSGSLSFGETSAEPAMEAGSVSMDFDGAPLNQVLRVFSQLSGLNFVASDEVKSKMISVYFDHVPVQDALESLIKANGLRYEQKEGSKIFLVYPTDSAGALETKIFALKYARLSTSPLDIGGQSVIDNLKTADISASSSSTSASSSASTAAGASSTSANLSAAKGIDKLVSSLLSTNGKMTVDLATNSLIVTDTADKLKEIEKVLADIDVAPMQVMIEVYLMEVKKTLLSDIGVEWGGTDGELARFTAGSRTTAFPFQETLFNASKGVKASTVTAASTLTLGTLSATSFKAILRFLISDTNTKILSRPRILTLNNEAASIKLVTNTAIANQTQTTAAEGQSTSVTNTAERQEIGISLRMTPQINSDQTVGLFVEPSVSTVAASTFFPSTFLDPTTRSVRTMARLKNHETLMIGGLLDKNKTMTKKKIPFLGDLPLIGHAFDYDNSDDIESELIIFITPHIVEGYETLNADTDLAVRRMLDNFEDFVVDPALTTLDNVAEHKAPLDHEQKKQVQDRMKKSVTSAEEIKMIQALDSFESQAARLPDGQANSRR